MRKLTLENAKKIKLNGQLFLPLLFSLEGMEGGLFIPFQLEYFPTLNGRPKTGNAVTLNPAVRSHLISLSTSFPIISFRCFLFAKCPSAFFTSLNYSVLLFLKE